MARCGPCFIPNMGFICEIETIETACAEIRETVARSYGRMADDGSNRSGTSNLHGRITRSSNESRSYDFLICQS